MNYLEICQEAIEEVSLQGSLASVETAVGYEHLICRKIMRAYKRLQESRPDWKFLRTSVTHTIVAGTQSYTPTDILGATAVLRFGHWDPKNFIYTQAGGNKYRLRGLSYDYWIGKDMTTPHGNPIQFTIQPQDNSVIFDYMNSNTDVDLHYYKSPQILSLNTDVPELPLENHDVLVWAGAKVAARLFENGSAYDEAKEQYELALGALMRSQIPSKSLTVGPIA